MMANTAVQVLYKDNISIVNNHEPCKSVVFLNLTLLLLHYLQQYFFLLCFVLRAAFPLQTITKYKSMKIRARFLPCCFTIKALAINRHCSCFHNSSGTPLQFPCLVHLSSCLAQIPVESINYYQGCPLFVYLLALRLEFVGQTLQ